MSGNWMPRDAVVAEAELLWTTDSPKWVVFTGGEPMLQLDRELVTAFRRAGFSCQIETNGTRAIPLDWEIDFITVSPKVAEHAIKQLNATEVKYVRGYGQAIPRTRVNAIYKFISPAFDGAMTDERAFKWCQQLVAENDGWDLSVQAHKVWGVR
jgi:organic radical activating enzyme